MSIDERIPSLSDQELTRLHDNALRLRTSGAVSQRNEAERVLPLIDAELAERRARAPARPPRKAPVRKKKA
jgi:hypothetical protein